MVDTFEDQAAFYLDEMSEKLSSLNDYHK